MSTALSHPQKIYIAYFKTDVKDAYDSFFITQEQVKGLSEALNTKRVVFVGDSVISSRLFEKCIPFESRTIPDQRIRNKFANAVMKAHRSGTGVNPEMAHRIEMRLLVESRNAKEFLGSYKYAVEASPHNAKVLPKDISIPLKENQSFYIIYS